MKKVLIVTSIGGGGHVSASQALEHYLQDEYDVITAYAFKDILASLDIFQLLTRSKYSGEDLYNIFLKKKYFRLIRFLFFYCGTWAIRLQQKRIRSLLYNYIVCHKVEVIISVIPLLNNNLLSIAQELNIPFILVPTDLDSSLFMFNIKNPSHKKFILCLSFDDESIKSFARKALIADKYIVCAGAPIKPDFLEEKSKSSLKEQYNIDPHKTIVMVMMGTQGSHDIEQHAQHLIKITEPVHFIFCIGKNEHSKQTLSRLTFPPTVTYSIIHFTPHIADYMALSDILVTKSGSISICEAIYMNIPLLLDATSGVLPWEKFNHCFIKEHGLGATISCYADSATLVSELITNKDVYQLYKRNLQAMKKENIAKNIKVCIKKLLT